MRAEGLRLLFPLALVNFTLFASLHGVLAVLLPERIAVIDPTGKVAVLAIVTSLSFAVTAVARHHGSRDVGRHRTELLGDHLGALQNAFSFLIARPVVPAKTTGPRNQKSRGLAVI